jgi:hypothetical protein
MGSESGLVDDGLAEQLERTCRTAVGDGLRSITYFTPDSHAQVYLRSDLDPDADLTGFVEQATDGFYARTAYNGSELGEYRYTVRSFENGYLTRVTADDRGVFITTDAMTLRSAEDVAEALTSVLDERFGPEQPR